jgi:hypothetical protein
MSELIQKNDTRATIRWKLLTGASALALTVSFTGAVRAEDSDRPLIWIELGGQLDRLETSQQGFAPPFFNVAPPSVLAPMVEVQKLPLYDIGEDGKITFEPTGSDWLFSASLRYGRAGSTRHQHYETARQTVQPTFLGNPILGLRDNEFGDGQGSTSESHLVADFQAGKDVGLGLFGAKGNSVVSAGVRFAQFTSGSDVTLHARPAYMTSAAKYNPGKYIGHHRHFHTYTAIIQSKRNTHAIGPTVSWDASLPFVGNSESVSMAFDWGVNAAVLFGRQRARIHHQTAGAYVKGPIVGQDYHTTYVNPPVDGNRSRSVMIPNVGGFAGISFRYTDAKVSFGYRGDFFFNAVDTGWDARKSSMVGFHGPFVSLSVGIGD